VTNINQPQKGEYIGSHKMLILNKREICPYGNTCTKKEDEGSVDGICYGLNPERTTVFECELVKQNGITIIGTQDGYKKSRRLVNTVVDGRDKVSQ
jgi:hypothetical protein